MKNLNCTLINIILANDFDYSIIAVKECQFLVELPFYVRPLAALRSSYGKCDSDGSQNWNPKITETMDRATALVDLAASTESQRPEFCLNF